ncbi:MAG: S-layer homology domain-containing protein [Acidimicrobiales bacterium]|nr:S-layer homology domain-containing protein [Acidimicrobiales bacterium]
MALPSPVSPAPSRRRCITGRLAVLAVAAVFALAASAVGAAPAGPSLDTTFSDDGLLAFGSQSDGADSVKPVGVVVLDDGSLATVEHSSSGMIRLRRVSTTGVVQDTTEFEMIDGVDGDEWSLPLAVGLHPDGDVLVSGVESDSGYHGVVAKIDPDDGSFDTGFGGNGVARLPVGHWAWSVAAASDGTVYVGGGDGTNAFVTALDSSGSVVTGFDGDGTVVLSHDADLQTSGTLDLVVDADDNVWACGTSFLGAARGGFVDVIDPSGAPVESFSGGGSFTSTAMIRACALDAGSHLWVGGGSATVTGIPLGGDAAVVGRIALDGTLDTSIGTAGWVTVADVDTVDAVHDLAVRRDGGAVAVALAHSNDDFIGADGTVTLSHVGPEGGVGSVSWSQDIGYSTADVVGLASAPGGRVHAMTNVFDNWIYGQLRTYLIPDDPGAPTGLGATAGVESVDLTWTAPDDLGGSALTGWVLEQRTGSDPWTAATDTDGDSVDTAATVTGLTADAEVEFRVAAVTSHGTGDASATATATPTAPEPEPEPEPDPEPSCARALAGGTIGCWNDDAAEHPFGDVVSGWQRVPVGWMFANGITTGTSASTYSPDDPVTRGQLAVLLWRLVGEPAVDSSHPFGDVVSGWQQVPVAWMFANGITTGTSASTYSPDDPVTRGQLAALLWRLVGEPAVDSSHPFGDVVSGWQQVPVAWMFANGITTGTSASTYSPDDPVTRGQVAAFLHRFAQML